MVGSKRWFQYENDAGLKYAVELDESVYESAALGFAAVELAADGPVATGRIIAVTASRPLQMRQVNGFFNDIDGMKVARTFYVGTVAAFAAIKAAGLVSVSGQTYGLTSAKGEVAKLVPSIDTGIIDGDVDSNVV